MVLNEELLIILRGQLNFDGDQKVAMIDQTTGCDWLVDDHNCYSFSVLLCCCYHLVSQKCVEFMLHVFSI